ncbi:MAG: diguanylate cyclase [Candidatus Nitrospinota bacterium M3_3B_026]
MKNEHSPSAGRGSILIVEDEKEALDTLLKIFEGEAGLVRGVSTGEEAIELLSANGFDLLIIDYALPGMNGIETVMKAKDMDQDMGAILMTGHSSERTIIEAFTLGRVDSYLSKPLDVEEARKTVSMALGEVWIRRKESAFRKELGHKVEEATAQLKEKNRLLERKERETASLNAQLKEEREQLREANERLVRLNEQLERLSITDGLTKLYNFRHFSRRIQEEFYRARRYEGGLSLLMLDIDDFKKVNDTYGHPTGDDVLRQVAGEIRASSRQPDVAARYGGEEFTLMLPEVGLAGAAVRAERLRKSLEAKRFEGKGKPFSITVSIGVATYNPEIMEEPDDLVKAADKALYNAKEMGKNLVVMAMDGRLKAVGKEAAVTERDCEKIGRAVLDYAGAVHDADRMIGYLVNRLGEAMETEKADVYISARMKDRTGAMTERARLGEYHGARDLAAAAADAVTKGKTQTEDSGDDPLSCLPIWAGAGGKKKAVGALVMNHVPSCLGHIGHLLDRLAPAVDAAIDLGERLEKAGELTRETGRYELLARLARSAAASAGSLEEALSGAADEITGALRAAAFSVYTYSPVSHDFTLAWRSPRPGGDMSLAEDVMMSRAAEIFSRRLEPIVIDDAKSFNGRLKGADAEVLSSVFAVAPMALGGKVVGAVSAVLPPDARRGEDVKFLESVASILAMAVSARPAPLGEETDQPR